MAIASQVQAQTHNGSSSDIQKGNILHCFNWPINEVKNALPQIAAAGFGSVQLSPLQRPDIKVGYAWHDLYRPYDLAFKESAGMGGRNELKALCSEAAKYGVKVIVDVVANHVDKTAGYHDPWWDQNGRVRWNGGINYGDRYSITHGQLGDYGDVNSEASEVIAKGKAYVEDLKSMGVKGIRWDAAKHIGLPSEGCGFWSAVASVPGVWHYGEILDNPGPNAGIIKEYANYMSVTDNQYCNYAARDNGGIPGGYGGAWAVDHGLGNKCVYWAESHDTYSNDDWSCNRDQATIDRAYAAFASRNDATCLYFSRPNTKGFNNIKVGKGSTHFTSPQVAQVNIFKNAMVGRADYFSSNGNACSITRKDGGAVIVMKGSGNVSITNGGGYCPAGTYKDRVSGGTFTVTASTISGNVGSSGIAVIMKDGLAPIDPGTDPGTDPDPSTGSLYILGNLAGSAGWSTTPGTGVAMTQSGSKYTAKNVEFTLASGETKCYFNITDYVGSTWDDLNMNANRYGSATEGEAITLGTPATIVKYTNNVNASGCLSWTIAPGKYDITVDLSTMKITVDNAGTITGPDEPGTDPDDPDPTPGVHYIYYDGTLSAPKVWAWNDTENCTTSGIWPGDAMTKKNGKWYWEVPAGKSLPTQVIISEGSDATKVGGGDLIYTDKATYHQNGTITGGGGDDPDPIDPDPIDPGVASLYILGNLDGASWITSAGKPMTQSGSKHTAKNVKLVAAAGETMCYFNLTDKLGATWDELNMNANRYGSATEGEAITLGLPATIVKYTNNVNASGCLSWTIAPGTYDITADLSAMSLTVTKSNTTGIGNIEDSSTTLKVYTSGGKLYVVAPKAQTVTVSTLSGMTSVRKVNSGINVIDGLAHGIYIVNGKKIVL